MVVRVNSTKNIVMVSRRAKRGIGGALIILSDDEEKQGSRTCSPASSRSRSVPREAEAVIVTVDRSPSLGSASNEVPSRMSDMDDAEVQELLADYEDSPGGDVGAFADESKWKSKLILTPRGAPGSAPLSLAKIKFLQERLKKMKELKARQQALVARMEADPYFQMHHAPPPPAPQRHFFPANSVPAARPMLRRNQEASSVGTPPRPLLRKRVETQPTNAAMSTVQLRSRQAVEREMESAVDKHELLQDKLVRAKKERKVQETHRLERQLAAALDEERRAKALEVRDDDESSSDDKESGEYRIKGRGPHRWDPKMDAPANTGRHADKPAVKTKVVMKKRCRSKESSSSSSSDSSSSEGSRSRKPLRKRIPSLHSPSLKESMKASPSPMKSSVSPKSSFKSSPVLKAKITRKRSPTASASPSPSPSRSRSASPSASRSASHSPSLSRSRRSPALLTRPTRSRSRRRLPRRPVSRRSPPRAGAVLTRRSPWRRVNMRRSPGRRRSRGRFWRGHARRSPRRSPRRSSRRVFPRRYSPRRTPRRSGRRQSRSRSPRQARNRAIKSRSPSAHSASPSEMTGQVTIVNTKTPVDGATGVITGKDSGGYLVRTEGGKNVCMPAKNLKKDETPRAAEAAHGSAEEKLVRALQEVEEVEEVESPDQLE